MTLNNQMEFGEYRVLLSLQSLRVSLWPRAAGPDSLLSMGQKEQFDI